jgi:transcriptional regulator with XRE-family HTH domain
MWLDNLKDLKARTGMSSKQIAEKTNLPERTVSRIFSGDTDNPYVDTLRRIVAVLGGSLDDIFAETGSLLSNDTMTELKAENDRLTAELELLRAENASLSTQVAALRAENDLQRVKIELKDEIIATHNYYIKSRST